ncbi:MAG: DUF6766 family protein, partial [Limisphaerales bacterium]
MKKVRRRRIKTKPGKMISKFLKDNSLSLAFAGLFIVMLIGQSISGLIFYNDQQAEHAAHQISFLEFISTGT